MSDSYGLLVSFNGLEYGATTEAAFVHGYEAGQIWESIDRAVSRK